MDRTQLISNVRSNLAGLGRGSLGVPVLLLAMLAMMTLPIPPFLLDVLFTFNIALSIVVLLVCVYALRPLDFAVFPTILLVATLLRLALNVASTRVVLLHGHDGHGAAGKVIQAFGEVVIGGNYVVGVVVFAILMIINFVVVTKGAGRISEVSARFTLDAMPGKQMAIDADLNAGLIEQEEAKKRRSEVAQEADFYGSMDGASKFVRGDAIAGLLILFINLIGGVAIGMIQHSMSFGDAGKVYALLTMHPVQVIAVTGGKGGVGKTNVSVNLALALADLGRRVMLLDADLGLANVDVLLGLTPKRTLADVIEGRCELRDVLLLGPGGVRIVPAASGTQSMVHLSPMQHAGLIQAFSDISDNLDVLVVDTAAGIGDSVVSFVRAAQEVLLVVCDEPTSITDAYALIKLLNRDHGMTRFRVLANMAHSPQEGRNLFAKLTKVTDRFLDVALQYVGVIPYDESVRKAVQKQRAVYEAFPRSKASLAFKAVAQKVDSWPLPANPRGHLEFFVERLVQHPATGSAV